MTKIQLSVKYRIWFPLALFIITGVGSIAPPSQAQELSRGQLVYVPVYSHIYYGDREQAFPLTVVLSIRNTDSKHSITVLRVDYNDTDGKLIRKYLNKPISLNPLASIRYVVNASDMSGGSGANFIVQWKAESDVNNPILEGIMIGTAGQQGISFTSRGQAVK
jgi:hypothetical protein